MANRRMFSKEVVRSDKFTEMSSDAQSLYFHLGMEADDDGFVTPKGIMRLINAPEDALRVLVAKQFVIPFDSGVVVVRDWKENNYLRTDRYKPTQYKEEMALLSEDNNRYTIGIPLVHAGKDRIGEDSIGKERKGEVTEPAQGAEVNEVINLFKGVNPSYARLFAHRTQRTAVERLLKVHGREKLEAMINFLPRSNNMEYVPVITTPAQLEAKMGQLVAALQKYKNKAPIIL